MAETLQYLRHLEAAEIVVESVEFDLDTESDIEALMVVHIVVEAVVDMRIVAVESEAIVVIAELDNNFEVSRLAVHIGHLDRHCMFHIVCWLLSHDHQLAVKFVLDSGVALNKIQGHFDFVHVAVADDVVDSVTLFYDYYYYDNYYYSG